MRSVKAYPMHITDNVFTIIMRFNNEAKNEFAQKSLIVTGVFKIYPNFRNDSLKIHKNTSKFYSGGSDSKKVQNKSHCDCARKLEIWEYPPTCLKMCKIQSFLHISLDNIYSMWMRS